MGAINEVNMLPGVVRAPNQPIVLNQDLAFQATQQCTNSELWMPFILRSVAGKWFPQAKKSKYNSSSIIMLKLYLELCFVYICECVCHDGEGKVVCVLSTPLKMTALYKLSM